MIQAANNAYYDNELDEFINVCITDMDPGINESVLKPKGSDVFLILLNARSSTEDQREGFEHAREHILRGVWEKYYVQEIEADTDASDE